MTKYILNSGGIRNNIEGGKKFFTEVVKGLGSNPKILLCLFAYPREKWEIKLEEVEDANLYPENVKPVFTLAMPDIFKEQVKDNDVIYIYGGDDHLLQYWLRQFDISRIWDNKIVATNSAGSNAMVKYFWTCDWRKCMDGFGILPIKFIPHYRSSFGKNDPRGLINWDIAYKKLEEYKEKDLPIYALKEGEFVVFEK